MILPELSAARRSFPSALQGNKNINLLKTFNQVTLNAKSKTMGGSKHLWSLVAGKWISLKAQFWCGVFLMNFGQSLGPWTHGTFRTADSLAGGDNRSQVGRTSRRIIRQIWPSE